MKLTDLKREHFPNGQTFSQTRLDRYTQARTKAFRDFFTVYALWLVIGIAAGFVLSLFLSGLIKYLLPVICVMAGALVGTKKTTVSLDAYRNESQKLCLSKKDLRIARKNLRHGTVAWGDKLPK